MTFTIKGPRYSDGPIFCLCGRFDSDREKVGNREYSPPRSAEIFTTRSDSTDTWRGFVIDKTYCKPRHGVIDVVFRQRAYEWHRDYFVATQPPAKLRRH
ncbi:hypothetical protein RvVAT039_pl08710 (plasmid) [Agrobacterium vitis]|nr:hypothetical protein RvVAR0630_pl06920 [Agrobacterium vitis]BCH68038.1 hypothetical protein RvVAT039_pl08710 [Agrobacterium vitis]